MTPRLELRVSADGRQSWSVAYRPKGGERQRRPSEARARPKAAT